MAELTIADLDKIVKDTVDAVEKGKKQIYEIYEAARTEMDHVRRDAEIVKEEMIQVIFKVDELERKERRGRIRLMEVSRNFSVYKEADIKSAYEEANSLQIELAVARAQEQNLRQKRDDLDIRLKRLKETVDKAESLSSQVAAALGFLGNQMGAVLGSLETMQQRQQFGAKIIQAQEEERRRVAREIHDGPAQAMANLVFRAEVCERLADTDIGRCKYELGSLREQVRLCLKETRKIIFDLRPMTLDDLGLVPTIRRVLDGVKERCRVSAEVQVIGEEKRVDSYVEVGLFRIVQEALNNIEKHAEATHVRVILEFRPRAVQVIVEDDGKGCNLDHVGKESFGIMGMKERVHLLNGDIEFRSKPEQGLKIIVKLPLL
ncbi:MAG: sensor histidine kinase [Sporomusaceae bacterium]|nr:sensor histidine kinase [Sporomusaceae bacterium]